MIWNLKMYSLLIFIVFLISKAKTNEIYSENPVIRVDCNYDSDKIYTVLKDKPLQIVIEKCRTVVVRCYDTYYNSELKRTVQFVNITKFNNTGVAMLNVTKVTAEMSTRWTCPVFEETHSPISHNYEGHSYTTKNTHFHLYVKGARPVIFSANNRNLTFAPVDLSVNHDGYADYAYEDGEEVDFFCRKTIRSDKLEVRLEYYNAEGNRLFGTKSFKKLNEQQVIRFVLKAKHDMNYLDCILTSLDPEREYRYRTTFYMKKSADTMKHAMILSVNGQKLTTFSDNEPTSDNYMFRYIDGEILNVTCQKMDDNIKGSLSFYNETGYIVPALATPEKNSISLKFSMAMIRNRTLTCVINNTDEQKPNARLLFLSDIPYNDVRIRGLPRNNVLFQHSIYLNQWTIEYEYSVNDTLQLICVSKHINKFHGPQGWHQSSQFYWKFQGQTFETEAIKSRNFANVYFSNLTFTKTLDETHDGAKIQCLYDLISKSVEIVLRLKPELNSDGSSYGFISDVDSKLHVMLPVGSVGVAAAIITMVCLAYWRRRTKRSNLIQNAYDNLSNQNDSPIPAFPNQWEANFDDSHYSKIDEGVMQENSNYATENDKLHKMPYQRQSNISENHYTEIDEYFEPKTDGLPTSRNNSLDKQATASHHFKSNQNFNNIGDFKQAPYDKLKHDLPFHQDLYSSNVGGPGKQNKSVTFGPNLSSKQDATTNDRRLNQISDSPNMNTDQGIYMKPGDTQKKPNYENNSVQYQKTENPLDFEYAEPYSELGISRKNDFYGF